MLTGTLRALLVGLVVTVSVGVASGSAATATVSVCLASQPTANAKACRVDGTSTGLRMTLLQLDPLRGVYRLVITSAKPARLAKLVRWTPPAGMTITAITRVASGRCSRAGGRIACVAAKPGPSLSLDFIANGFPIAVAPARAGRPLPPPCADACVFLWFLDVSRGLYRLSLENTSGLGFINTFSWVPPELMTIRSITSSAGGKCRLESNTLICRGARQGIAPPRDGPGGSLTVDFLVSGPRPTYSGLHGVTSCCVHILRMTPVPYHMSSHPREIDLPLCRNGRASTKASPCQKA